MSVISFSPLLTTGRVSLIFVPGFFRPEMLILVCQVATKMLLHSLDPIPLACVICYYFSKKELREKCSNSEYFNGATEIIDDLITYAKSLIEGKKVKISAVMSLNSNVFSDSEFHQLIVKGVSNKLPEHVWNRSLLTHGDAFSMIRQFSQHKHLLADGRFYQNIRVPLLVILKVQLAFYMTMSQYSSLPYPGLLHNQKKSMACTNS